jgi:hypothetical protein
MPSESSIRKALRTLVTRILAFATIRPPVARLAQALECPLHHSSYVMQVSFDREQTETLRELLQTSLEKLLVETVHTDDRDYRAMLDRREQILKSMLAKVVAEPVFT